MTTVAVIEATAGLAVVLFGADLLGLRPGSGEHVGDAGGGSIGRSR